MTYPAECALTHSRMASFTRVCQPLPEAFRAASTSASKRIVVGTLSGLADGGRPMLRTNGLAASHSASVNGIASGSDIAAAVMAASSSGVLKMVPGLSAGITFPFSRIRLAQTDDAAQGAAIHKGHEEQAQPDVADAALTRLTIHPRRSDHTTADSHSKSVAKASETPCLATLAASLLGSKVILMFIIVLTISQSVKDFLLIHYRRTKLSVLIHADSEVRDRS